MSKPKFKYGDEVIWKNEFFGEVKGVVEDYLKSPARYWFVSDKIDHWVLEKELKKDE